MKPLSRLHGGLLAKKGSAAPSTDLRLEAGSLDRILEPMPPSRPGDEAPNVGSAAMSSYDGLHSRPRFSILKQPSKSKAQAKKDPGVAERVAMTVRMDEDQHLKLKVYCAHTKKSAQEVFLEALDSFIAAHKDDTEMADCGCFQKVCVHRSN